MPVLLVSPLDLKPKNRRACAWGARRIIATAHRVWGRKALLGAWFLASAGLALAGASNQPPRVSTGLTTPVIPPLTRVAQILDLSPKQAQAHRPVRVRGIVTCYDNGMVLFVQDETAGVFVYYTGDRLALREGEAVEITGSTRQGRYSPIIDPDRIEPLKQGPAINPKPVSLAQLCFGGLDAQWVETTGVVRSQKLIEKRLALELADPPHRVTVWIPDHRGYKDLPLLGSFVRVRGVAGAGADDHGQLKTFQIFANTLSDIAVLRAAPADPFAEPPILIRNLGTHHVREDMPGRARVQGVVTLYWPGHALFIQDPTGGLEVRTGQPIEGLGPGATLDVAGYLGPPLEAPRLEDALVRKTGTEPLPKPLRLSPDDFSDGDHGGQLVEINSRLLGVTYSPSNCLTLALQTDNHLVTALLNAPQPQETLTALQPGCRLRVTGVCRSSTGFGGDPELSLLLRSPMDLQVIAPPVPPYAPEKQALAACAILASLGLAGALWHIRQQRLRTEHALQSRATLEAEMRQGEHQLRRSVEERERMSRDLHDDIMQSIYAVGLSLEDCRRVVRQSPDQAEPRLAAAIHTLNNTIRSVRGFIAGLEPKVLHGREFKTALKSLALTSGDAPAQFGFEVDPAAANRLTSTQATQLLHIAKEAMSNSVRHAHASAVTVSLHPDGAGARLEIRDDGMGFDPASANGKGHGLRNMTTRAREIGAELQLHSAPGQGCRIVVTIPQRNSNEHA